MVTRPAYRDEKAPPSAQPRLADLSPPPQKHGHGYHGVFASNDQLRAAVTAPPTHRPHKHR